LKYKALKKRTDININKEKEDKEMIDERSNLFVIDISADL